MAVDYKIAIASGTAFAVLNLVAFISIMRKRKNGPLLLIATSILNKAVSYPIFTGGINELMIWTVILIVFALLDYGKLSKKQ